VDGSASFEKMKYFDVICFNSIDETVWLNYHIILVSDTFTPKVCSLKMFKLVGP